MAKFVIFGAFDRYNYGDLLFPLILRRALLDRGVSDHEIIYSAPRAASYEDSGGVACLSLNDVCVLLQSEPDTYLIVAGGDVLGVTWSTIYLYLLPRSLEIPYRATRFLLGDRILSRFIARSHGFLSDYPFTLDATDFRGFSPKVMFNCVGGNALFRRSPSDLEKLRTTLTSCEHLSVRDNTVWEFIHEHGLHDNCRLAPDCAVLLSKYFPKSGLLASCTSKIRAKSLAARRYICFQSAFKYSFMHFRAIAKALDSLAETHDLDIGLVAIGTATSHDDHVTIRHLVRHLKHQERVFIVDTGDLFDVMATIAHAKLYVGTSLHGAITALSYEVPRMALTSRVGKLLQFLSTWDDVAFHGATEYRDLERRASDLLLGSHMEKMRAIKRLAIGRSEANFEAMFRNLPEVFPVSRRP